MKIWICDRACLARIRTQYLQGKQNDAHTLPHSPGSLADIVAGVSADSDRRDLYVLAFTVIRALISRSRRPIDSAQTRGIWARRDR